MDPDGDAAGHGTLGRHADKLVLQPGEPRAAQRLCALAATVARSRTSEHRICELVPSVTGSTSGEPSDDSTAARHGWRSWEHARRSLPAATPTGTADMDELELLGGQCLSGCWEGFVGGAT